jgi:hypothetical protein
MFSTKCKGAFDVYGSDAGTAPGYVSNKGRKIQTGEFLSSLGSMVSGG